jgi:hypothetical protein
MYESKEQVNIVGDLMIAEYQVDKLRHRVRELVVNIFMKLEVTKGLHAVDNSKFQLKQKKENCSSTKKGVSCLWADLYPLISPSNRQLLCLPVACLGPCFLIKVIC